ncbi:hypothetical protein HYR54_08195 [Candidatus Acetothermia bacterium]|nr:hypothetical protein [Candidatus Acetothermia bacterium]
MQRTEEVEVQDGYKGFQAQFEALRKAATECRGCAQRLDSLLRGFDTGELQRLEAGRRILRLKVAALNEFTELLKQWEREFERIDEQLAATSPA